jgi:hypothetical protein
VIAKRVWLVGLSVFALLSLIDFIQTYALINGGEGSVYEANPVANAWLQQYGWNGLAVFKIGAVVVFVAAAVLVAIRRPRVGAAVMAAGCLALLSVTVYSSRLLAATSEPEELGPTLVMLDVDQPLPVTADMGAALLAEDLQPRHGSQPQRPTVFAD